MLGMTPVLTQLHTGSLLEGRRKTGEMKHELTSISQPWTKTFSCAISPSIVSWTWNVHVNLGALHDGRGPDEPMQGMPVDPQPVHLLTSRTLLFGNSRRQVACSCRLCSALSTTHVRATSHLL